MGGFVPISWVTQCLNPEKDFENVLVLGKSLRNVMTKATISIIIGKNISSKQRTDLENLFDLVIDDRRCDKVEGLLAPDEIGQIFSLSLGLFRKCIYIRPNTFFLKNCDHLFEKDLGLASMENSQLERNCASPHFLCILKPSSDKVPGFLEELLALQEKGCRRGNKRLIEFVEEFYTSRVSKILNEPCVTSIRLQEGQKSYENMEHFGIVHLADLETALKMSRDGNDLPASGVLENVIFQRWLDISKSIVERDLPLELPIMEMEKVAIVGMSCRFPKANNLSEFWKLLIEGQDGASFPPVGRWTKEKSPRYFPESHKMKAGFLCVAEDEFDGKFFGISPKEVAFMDPQLRIVMELVWESLEDAGINPHLLSGTKGSVFLGTWKSDYREIVHKASNDILRMHTGCTSGAMAARVAHFLGLKGPCIGTESDCAAGMVAVHMACNSLRNGESDLAFACGANLLIKPFDGRSMPHFFAPDGQCKTFDKSADGFGRADGCAVLLLKRYSDAVKNGDRIWGLIRGSAVAQEGLSHSMGTPTASCEAEAMKLALQRATVDASQVDYVEAHGTGTPLGDPVEIQAIEEAYGNCGRKGELLIGSVKTNIGHTEACSGIAGMIKVLLSMWHEQIPPHRKLKQLNPQIKLNAVPARVPLEAVPWKKNPNKPRLAGVSSFGVAGADAHLILEEPNNPPSPEQKIIFKNYQRPLHIIQLSAKTEIALSQHLERFQTSLALLQEDGNKKDETFANFAYTSNIGRAPLLFKAALIAKDCVTALKILKNGSYLKSLKNVSTETEATPKICFLFTGHGSQYQQMGHQLYETCPLFRIHFDFCDSFLQSNYNFSLVQIYFGNDRETDTFKKTIYSQTGLLVVQFALFKLWESWGIKPHMVLGHSVGEFGAAVCSGILTIAEALTILTERNLLPLQEGKMLAVNANKEALKVLQNVCETSLDYAAYNSNSQTVVAGDAEEILKFKEYLDGQLLKNVELSSSHAFHSKHLDPILEDFRKVTEKISNKSPSKSCQFISGMLGKSLDKIDQNYWVDQFRNSVNFKKASEYVCGEMDCKIFVEIGPVPILTSIILTNNPQQSNLICLPSLRKSQENWETMLNSLGRLAVVDGIAINWEGFDRFYPRRKIGHLLPSYPFQRTKNWITPDPDCDSLDGTMVSLSSTIFSPLLGSLIPNSTEFLIFQNSLKLQNLPYFQDHLLDFTLFPGAAIIEMLLSASYFKANGINTSSKFRLPSTTIALNNFRILAPLQLSPNKDGTTLQVVVSTSPSRNIEAKLSHYEKTEDSWILHASGQFSHFNQNQDNLDQIESEMILHQADKATVVSTFNKIKSSYILEEANSNLIDLLRRIQLKTGYKFGPSFQIISNVYTFQEKLVAEIASETLTTLSEDSSYFLHPTLTDAMIQMAIFSRSLLSKDPSKYKKLPVPVGCHKFIWFNKLDLKSPQNCYIYSNPNCMEQSAVLFSGEGILIAAIFRVEAVLTNMGAIKAACESQVKKLPDLYKTKWSQENLEVISEENEQNQDTNGRWLLFYSKESHSEIVELLQLINEKFKE